MSGPGHMIVSYRLLRRFLGCLGLALPVALVAGGFWSEHCVRPSISAFYYSPSPILHGLFVGTMCAIGAFLVCYKGHPQKPGEFLNDDWIATVAGIGAFGIALFPTDPSSRVECLRLCLGDRPGPQGAGWGEGFNTAHIAFSLLFFAAITAMSWFQFAKSDKPVRRVIYRFCAALITVSVLLIVILEGLSFNFDRYSVIFGIEALAVWAFGAAWLAKGWK